MECLDLDARKYLRLRKVLRTFKFVCLIALFVLVFFDRKDFVEIIGCMAVVVIVPEAFLAIQRWEIKAFIRHAKLQEDENLTLYSKLKTDAEELRDELLSRESDPNLPAESLKFLQKVRSGDDWLSGRIRYFKSLSDEFEKNLKQLNDLERLVVL